MYTEVTIDEMRLFLKAEKGWVETPSGGQETTFDFGLKNGVVIRVFSSIPTVGISRAYGKDAIRVAAVTKVNGVGTVRGLKKFPRVTRQENWRIHLKSRIMDAFNWAKRVKKCPMCQCPLALREPKKGQKWSPFLSCISQDCNYTYSI